MSGEERVVLLWGVPGDAPLAAVYQVLQARGCPVVLLDQRKVAETEIDLTVRLSQCIELGPQVAAPEADAPHAAAQQPEASQPEVSGTFRTGEAAYDLSAIRSIYLRPYDYAELPWIAAEGPESVAWRHASAFEEALTTWADLTPALVVNRPSAMAANGSKPYQADWIASFGLRVPETLITTDSAAALGFWREHGEVIYKSLSGTRSIVSRLRPEHAARLEHLAACPTQFQEYIVGTEHRVHVVGDLVFACRIRSGADDYRYSAEPVEMDSCELPEEIARVCVRMAAEMDLPLAGIDLRCTPEGEWYCFEVNPSPGFTYFEAKTGQPIAAAVAALLAGCGSR
jgi:glutathione synthase/RimK-type ligase-like ATP-grasp enzyme